MGLCTAVSRFIPKTWECRFFFFKQKTAYEMCGRDWSSDVCSSDLRISSLDDDESMVEHHNQLVIPMKRCKKWQVLMRIYNQ